MTISPLTIIDFFTDNNQSFSSTLIVDSQPYQQTIQHVYSSPYPISKKLKHSCSFSDWTNIMKEIAINSLFESLVNVKIPIKKISLSQIYQLLSFYRKKLCENTTIHYPAIFKAEIVYTPLKTSLSSDIPSSSRIYFELEIFSAYQASLIFNHYPETFIEKGKYRTVEKVFSLEHPKILARSYTRIIEDHALFQRITQNDENVIKICGPQSMTHFIKIYHIFHYYMIQDGTSFPQQIIVMKFYPRNLKQAILSNLSDQTRVRFSIQMVEAIHELHQQEILHRDVKPDNFVVSEKKVCIIDFNLSCHTKNIEESKKKVGTLSFVPPSVFNQKVSSEMADDMWALGCSLWFVLGGQNTYYPWYNRSDESNDLNLFKERFLNLVKIYDQQNPLPSSKFTYLLWNILRLNPEDRWRPEQIIDYLKKLELELPKEESFHFDQQFALDYEPTKNKIDEMQRTELRGFLNNNST